jgi:hypothetical protein
MRIGILAVAVVAVAGSLVQAAPILSVDFNGRPFGTGALGPTHPDFQTFDIPDNNALGNPSTTISKSFTSSLSTTVGVTVTAYNGTLLQGRDRPGNTVNAGAFTYANLYRDFIFSNPGNTVGMDLILTGLTPGGSYELRVYSYDDSTSAAETAPSTVRWTVTAGTGGFGEISFQRNNVDPTSNDQYSVLIPVLADSAGGITLRSSRSAGTGNVQVLNGFHLSEGAPIPEPAMLGLLVPAGLLLGRRR